MAGTQVGNVSLMDQTTGRQSVIF